MHLMRSLLHPMTHINISSHTPSLSYTPTPSHTPFFPLLLQWKILKTPGKIISYTNVPKTNENRPPRHREWMNLIISSFHLILKYYFFSFVFLAIIVKQPYFTYHFLPFFECIDNCFLIIISTFRMLRRYDIQVGYIDSKRTIIIQSK